MRRSGEVERSGKERPKRKGCEAVNQNLVLISICIPQ